MDKFVFMCILLLIAVLIGAGSTARKELSWENGYLVYNNERQADPFFSDNPNILKFHLNDIDNPNANIIVKLNNNPTTRSFVRELPMNLSFQKYGEDEVISYLDTKLVGDNSSEGYAPERGDFCYYTPWGNVVFFTQDGSFVQGLIKIGEVQEGMQYLAQLDNSSNVSVDFTD